MSDDDGGDQRERALRRIRRFYSISAQREWERLERPVDGRLEYDVHRAWIGRFLPARGSRIWTSGAVQGAEHLAGGAGLSGNAGGPVAGAVALAREKAKESELR
jgi:hypothetical protein